ncbi:MAG: VOC family protein [Synoicihabitans sp.]
MIRLLLSSLLLLSASLAWAVPPRIPALVQPASGERLPGKIIWADLVSTEPNASARFYGALLGWSSRTLSSDTGKYTVLATSEGPVVGVARGPDRKDDRPSARWIPFFSRSDLSGAETAIAASGGDLVAPTASLPERGAQLIATDGEGALFGLMRSSSGDPADKTVPEGGLFWANLFSESPATAASFFQAVAGLNGSSSGSSSYTLSAGGKARASISPIEGKTSVTSTWVPYFRIGDFERKLTLARRLGAKIAIEPRTFGNGTRVVVLVDPLGAVFALTQINSN